MIIPVLVGTLHERNLGSLSTPGPLAPVAITLLTLTWITLSLRIWTRCWVSKLPGWDDWTMCFVQVEDPQTQVNAPANGNLGLLYSHDCCRLHRCTVELDSRRESWEARFGLPCYRLVAGCLLYLHFHHVSLQDLDGDFLSSDCNGTDTSSHNLLHNGPLEHLQCCLFYLYYHGLWRPGKAKGAQKKDRSRPLLQ